MSAMESQRDYLNRRALEEEEAAARATSEKVRELHEEMASRYRDAAGAKDERREAEAELATVLPADFRIID
jgi:outer membrane protein TolC